MYKQDDNCFVYAGESMYPTLRVFDKLHIVPYNKQRVRRGDVIIISLPDTHDYVIHRVISVDSRGISTRGDNSMTADPWKLQVDNICGVVTCVERNNKYLPVYGGLRGRLYLIPIRIIRAVILTLIFLLKPPYRWLIKKRFFVPLSRSLLKTRILYFSHPQGTECQLLIGRYVIGRFFPNSERWYIRRPFRLFIDEASLPRGDIQQI